MAYIPIGITSIVNTVPSSVQVGASIMGHAPVVIIGGSVATASTNTSVMLLNSAGVIGSIAALQGTNPWTVNVGASVAAVIIGGSVATATTNSSVMLLNSAAIIGSIAALQGTNPWIVNVGGSVATAIISGSIAATFTPPANQSVSGTVQSEQIGTRITSVISSNPSSLLTGQYGHRNDAVASFLGGNLTWNPKTTDSAGRTLVKPFTAEDGTIISFKGSVVSGSVTLIQASAIGLKSYITDFWIVNTGATNQLITFQDGSTSVLGYTIAPSGGGSNSPGISIPLKTATSQDLAFKATGTSSIVYVTVKGFVAP